MKIDKITLTLTDPGGKSREMNEIHRMLTEIDSVVDRYGYVMPRVDVELTVVLTGTIKPIFCDIKFSPGGGVKCTKKK